MSNNPFVRLIKGIRRRYKKYASDRERLSTFYKQLKHYNFIADAEHRAERRYLYPCLYDSTQETEIEPIYFYQDVWAFERIFNNRPATHVDIGSHHKFVAFLSKITKLTMIDVRPLSLKLDSINFTEGTILDLPFKDNSIESISSLCVIEHIGLGRYGDPLGPLGSEKAISEITRVLGKDAHLYLSAPVSDKTSVHFNAGRIFCLEYLMKLLKDYRIARKDFIVNKSLTDIFAPNDYFQTTILLDLVKN